MRTAVLLFMAVAPALAQGGGGRPGLKPGRQVLVRLLGPDARPVVGAQFVSSYRSKRGGGGGPCRVSWSESAYVVQPIDWEKRLGQGGAHTLRIVTPDYGAIQQVFRPKIDRELVIRLTRPASVHVTLQGYARSRHVGQIFVAVKRRQEADRQFAVRRGLDADGRMTLAPVQSGASEILVGVRVQPRAKHSLFWTVARVAVALKPGENNLTIPMPQLHAVTVRGTPQTRFRVSPVGKRRDVYIEYVTTDRQGVVIVPRLAAGRYELSGFTNGVTWKAPVAIPAPAGIRIP